MCSSWAGKCTAAYLNSPSVDAEAARKLMSVLKEIPARSPTIETLHGWERLCFLDAMQRQAIQYKNVDELKHIDWNKAFRIGNQFYDRLANAETVDDYKRVRNEIDAMLRAAEDFSRNNAVSTGRGFQADKIALIKLSKDPEELVVTAFLKLMFPDYVSALNADHRALARLRLVLTLAAIRTFERTSAVLPRTLQEIAGNATEDYSIDPFTGQSLIYRPTGKAAIIYSVGPNKQDDNASEYDGRSEAYDFVVRLADLPPPPIKSPQPKVVVEKSVTSPDQQIQSSSTTDVVSGSLVSDSDTHLEVSPTNRSNWPVVVIGLTVLGGLISCLMLVFWRRQ